jgi:hypothetical protein
MVKSVQVRVRFVAPKQIVHYVYPGTPARRNWQGQPPIQASAQWLHIQTQPKEGII